MHLDFLFFSFCRVLLSYIGDWRTIYPPGNSRLHDSLRMKVAQRIVIYRNTHISCLRYRSKSADFAGHLATYIHYVVPINNIIF